MFCLKREVVDLFLTPDFLVSLSASARMEVLDFRCDELSLDLFGHFGQLFGHFSPTKAQNEERIQPTFDYTLCHRYNFLDFQYPKYCIGIGIK